MTVAIDTTDLAAELARFDVPVEVVVAATSGARVVATADLHRPGLALCGHLYHAHPERLQVFGETEVTFLQGRSPDERRVVLGQLCRLGVPAMVVTRGQAPPDGMIDTCRAFGVALFRTSLNTGAFIRGANRALAELLAPQTTLHGVVVDVFGIGVLLSGPSGIGKSECALELVMRGHRLVADDLVEVRLLPPATLVCRSAELIKQHMEIRGLGIINVQDMFGVAAVRDQKRLQLIVHLEPWHENVVYDRLGADSTPQEEILGVGVPKLTVPVRPGRSMSEVVEVAARNQILKIRGVDSARRFQDRLLEEIKSAQHRAGGPGLKPLLRDDLE